MAYTQLEGINTHSSTQHHLKRGTTPEAQIFLMKFYHKSPNIEDSISIIWQENILFCQENKYIS